MANMRTYALRHKKWIWHNPLYAIFIYCIQDGQIWNSQYLWIYSIISYIYALYPGYRIFKLRFTHTDLLKHRSVYFSLFDCRTRGYIGIFLTVGIKSMTTRWPSEHRCRELITKWPRVGRLSLGAENYLVTTRWPSEPTCIELLGDHALAVWA